MKKIGSFLMMASVVVGVYPGSKSSTAPKKSVGQKIAQAAQWASSNIRKLVPKKSVDKKFAKDTKVLAKKNSQKPVDQKPRPVANQQEIAYQQAHAEVKKKWASYETALKDHANSKDSRWDHSINVSKNNKTQTAYEELQESLDNLADLAKDNDLIKKIIKQKEDIQVRNQNYDITLKQASQPTAPKAPSFNAQSKLVQEGATFADRRNLFNNRLPASSGNGLVKKLPTASTNTKLPEQVSISNKQLVPITSSLQFTPPPPAPPLPNL